MNKCCDNRKTYCPGGCGACWVCENCGAFGCSNMIGYADQYTTQITISDAIGQFTAPEPQILITKD